MGMRIDRAEPSLRWRRAYRSAIHSTTASFANSDGCSCSGPGSGSQLRLPLTSRPTLGMNVAPISRTETMRNGRMSLRIIDSGIRAAITAPMSPITANSACRSTIAKELWSYRLYASTELALRTMISPRPSRSPDVPSTSW